MFVLVVYLITTAWILTSLTLPSWCVFATLGINALFVFLGISATVSRQKGLPPTNTRRVDGSR